MLRFSTFFFLIVSLSLCLFGCIDKTEQEDAVYELVVSYQGDLPLLITCPDSDSIWTFSDLYAPLILQLMPANETASGQDIPSLHISRVRVHHAFRGDYPVGGTFDQHVDYFLPAGQSTTWDVKLFHADQMEDLPFSWCWENPPEDMPVSIEGGFIVFMWGETLDGQQVSGETRIPMRMIFKRSN